MNDYSVEINYRYMLKPIVACRLNYLLKKTHLIIRPGYCIQHVSAYREIKQSGIVVQQLVKVTSRLRRRYGLKVVNGASDSVNLAAHPARSPVTADK